MKKLLSTLISLSLMLAMVSPSFAYNPNRLSTFKTVSVNTPSANSMIVDFQQYSILSDAELKQIILDIGLSTAQADELIELKNIAQKQDRVTRASRFPSNPSIGDIFVDRVYLSGDALVTSASAFQELINAGVPATAAAAGAAVAYALANDFNGPSAACGVVLTIEYYYGADNDGEVRWNYRRVWGDYYT